MPWPSVWCRNSRGPRTGRVAEASRLPALGQQPVALSDGDDTVEDLAVLTGHVGAQLAVLAAALASFLDT